MRLRRAFRTAAKTATYRTIAALETFGLAWFLTGHLGAAGAIVGFAEIGKTAIYVLHETVWNWATEEE